MLQERDAHTVGYYVLATGGSAEEGLGLRDGAERRAEAYENPGQINSERLIQPVLLPDRL